MTRRIFFKKGEVARAGNDLYWEVIREAGANGRLFSRADVVGRFDAVSSADIYRFLKRLEKGRYLEIVTTNPLVYRLRRRPKETPSLRADGSPIHHGRGQLHMWNAIRSLGNFNALELMAAASTSECYVSHNTAKSYLQNLCRAGYLIVVDEGGPNKPATYRLKPSMNTGPKPPQILKTKIVFDQNRQEIVGDVVAETAS